MAVGHRVVHGGERYAQPVLIDNQVLADLVRLIPLVPLHQPHNLAAIRAVSESHPQLRQVACFDTAFHRHRPAVSERFGLPFELKETVYSCVLGLAPGLSLDDVRVGTEVDLIIPETCSSINIRRNKPCPS